MFGLDQRRTFYHKTRVIISKVVLSLAACGSLPFSFQYFSQSVSISFDTIKYSQIKNKIIIISLHVHLGEKVIWGADMASCSHKWSVFILQMECLLLFYVCVKSLLLMKTILGSFQRCTKTHGLIQSSLNIILQLSRSEVKVIGWIGQFFFFSLFPILSKAL